MFKFFPQAEALSHGEQRHGIKQHSAARVVAFTNMII